MEMKKKVLVLLMIVLLLLVGCGQKQNTMVQERTAEFTDSLGRTVTVPEKITKIAISGPLSQVYILPLAGDMLVGVSNAFAEDAQIYIAEDILNKTEIGQLYGGKREMDLEALLASDPDVVIDIGQAKKSMAEDFDALTEQTGIPFIHIDADVSTAAEAYRTLGKLISREEKAEKLASWCENTYDGIQTLMEKVDADNARKTLLYCLGEKGTNVIAEGSFHAQIVNLMSRNVAVIEDVVSSGDGNQVDLEQILFWDPEVIVFSYDSCYHTVGDAAQWQSVTAIAEGTYYEAPYGPYGWLSSPPAVQSYLGMLWLGSVLYPDYVNYDLQEEVTAYYELFYGCNLTESMYTDLIGN
jgi:iron complex transport system substrate-binding protein